MIIKRFKNGNFNVRYEPKYDYNDHLIEQLCNSIELDFSVVSEWWSIGNYDTGMYLFNYNTGLTYVITGSDVEQFKQGGIIKLIGFNDYIRRTTTGGIEQ